MPISRRIFLRSGTLTALAAGVSLSCKELLFGQQRTQKKSSDLRIPSKAQRQPTYFFTVATFEPYVGDFFTAPNAQGKMVGLELVRVTAYKPSSTTRISTAKSRETASFSLTFKAEGPLPPFTSIHRVSHPRLGEFDLFLKPSPQEGGAMFYEAVFNHI